MGWAEREEESERSKEELAFLIMESVSGFTKYRNVSEADLELAQRTKKSDDYLSVGRYGDGREWIAVMGVMTEKLRAEGVAVEELRKHGFMETDGRINVTKVVEAAVAYKASRERQ